MSWRGLKTKAKGLKLELLNLRDAQHSAGCAQHLANLYLKAKFSLLLGHCALVITAELGSKCLGMYLER